MRILVLGGTAFLGRAVAEEAMARGHDVTCAARGTAAPPAGVTFVTLDRDGDDGLAAVRDHSWEGVVDVSRQPGQVRRAVRELSTALYLLVSTSNVYASFDTPEQSEDAVLRAPLDGDVMASMAVYGEAKVACEKAVLGREGPSAVVRPALIGGPGDTSGRSGYWPWRFAHPSGDDVLAPDDPSFPVAILDVRDLAAFLVTLVEGRAGGIFNAAGATTTLASALATARAAAGGAPAVRWVPLETVAREGIQAWSGPRSFPLWIDDPAYRHFTTLDTARARAAGLRLRPLAETLAAADHGPSGLTDDEEEALRRALDAPGGAASPRVG